MPQCLVAILSLQVYAPRCTHALEKRFENPNFIFCKDCGSRNETFDESSSKHFAMASRPNRVLSSVQKCFEENHRTFLSAIENLRLGEGDAHALYGPHNRIWKDEQKMKGDFVPQSKFFGWEA